MKAKFKWDRSHKAELVVKRNINQGATLSEKIEKGLLPKWMVSRGISTNVDIAVVGI